VKARLVPIFFKSKDEEFDIQLERLNTLLLEDAEFLKPVELGETLPEAEAVIFPQFLGDAYRQLPEFKQISLPILIVTSEFGTVSMWDWEIASFLRSEGVETIAPYNLGQTQMICKALSVRRTDSSFFRITLVKVFRQVFSKDSTGGKMNVRKGWSINLGFHSKRKALKSWQNVPKRSRIRKRRL
jgi:hypothetical protein